MPEDPMGVDLVRDGYPGGLTRRQRLGLVYCLRSNGATFEEIGRRLRRTNQRAMELDQEAERRIFAAADRWQHWMR